MKSVGEVMAIGRTQMESLQKALRGLETGVDGLDEKTTDKGEIVAEMGNPGAERLFYVADAFRVGMTQDEVFQICKIDPWFLVQIEDLVRQENALKGRDFASLTRDELHTLKRNGFSDRRLATLLGSDQHKVRAHRWSLGVNPVYKRVDTCAAEFASHTAYLYSTYEEECEALPSDRQKIMVLGGGPNRIGQGIEFDYCCVHAAQACARTATRPSWSTATRRPCPPTTTPPTACTSSRSRWKTCWRSSHRKAGRRDRPVRRPDAAQAGARPGSQRRAHHRHHAGHDRRRRRPRALPADAARLGLLQPPNRTARTEPDALRLAAEIGYPLVVRPSYVLGGRAMEIVYTKNPTCALHARGGQGVQRFAGAARPLPQRRHRGRRRRPLRRQDVLIGGIMEHIEQAGVHSGDSACSLPPYSSPGLAGRDAPPDRRHGQGAECGRPDERAVRRSRARRFTCWK
jgi:carbamoyl-phosphate synthase large subunit